MYVYFKSKELPGSVEMGWHTEVGFVVEEWRMVVVVVSATLVDQALAFVAEWEDYVLVLTLSPSQLFVL